VRIINRLPSPVESNSNRGWRETPFIRLPAIKSTLGLIWNDEFLYS
jgi:hypothetical protein